MVKELWIIKKISVSRQTNERTENFLDFEFENKNDGFDKIEQLKKYCLDDISEKSISYVLKRKEK